MSEYFGPSGGAGSIFSGEYASSSQGLFDGDFYAEDEPVRRGVTLNTAFPADPVGKFDSKAAFGNFDGDAQPLSRRLVFPGCSGVELDTLDTSTSTGKTVFSSAAPTELAAAVMDYFSQMDSVTIPNESKRSIKVHLCSKYEYSKFKVSFAMASAQTAAMVFERKIGDSIEFGATVRGCEKHLKDRGLSTSVSLERSAAPFAQHMAPHLAKLPLETEDDSWLSGPPRPALWGSPDDSRDFGERTPNFLFELPSLTVEPCEAEDLQPLLEMATEYADSKAEAAVEFCRMIDGETDAATVAQVLQSRPQVLLGLLQEPAAVYAAPALVAKLVPRALEMDWSPVVQTVCSRLADKSQSALGKRQLARCLEAVLAHGVQLNLPGLLEELEQLANGEDDTVTKTLILASLSL